MKTLNVTFITAGLLGLTLALPVAAQQTPRDFPAEGSSQASCDSVSWNSNMLEEHPRLIDACQEVVDVDGSSWARFDVRFKEIERDGTVAFDVRDSRGRAIEQARFMPVSGQVAYIDDRETPFGQLRSSDAISLYVPEGQYGFATRPGVARDQVAQGSSAAERSATAERSTTAEAPVETDRAVARSSDRQSTLPATASAFSWFALAGFLSILAGLTLTMRRWS